MLPSCEFCDSVGEGLCDETMVRNSRDEERARLKEVKSIKGPNHRGRYGIEEQNMQGRARRVQVDRQR